MRAADWPFEEMRGSENNAERKKRFDGALKT